MKTIIFLLMSLLFLFSCWITKNETADNIIAPETERAIDISEKSGITEIWWIWSSAQITTQSESETLKGSDWNNF